MLKLDRCINELTDSRWTIIPYDKDGGNYYTARWCVGSGAGYPGYPCGLSGETEHDRDQYVLWLYTAFYPSDFPEVSGIGMNVYQVPETEGWGVNLAYIEDILRGNGFWLNFDLYPDPVGEPQSHLYTGPGLEYKVHETVVQVDYNFSLSPRDEFSQFIASSESMRDNWLARDEELHMKVIQVIGSGDVTTCDYGPYKGDGTEPECLPRPLSSAEFDETLTAAEQFFMERRNLMLQNYQEMYDALLRAFPFDRCWD
jgi:hypothetical protein